MAGMDTQHNIFLAIIKVKRCDIYVPTLGGYEIIPGSN